ncbi:MAG: vWA domain-containing protein [Candidatus Binataceae bacterium]
MGILNPLNLLYAATIAILLAIYLRARSRPTVEVSSLMLFDEAPAPVQRVRYLRLDPLFWLETAALAALTLAVAGLYLMMPPVAGSGRTRALVFDLGAAMGGDDSGSTRLDSAKREALDLVAGATPGDRFSVIGYALEAHVYQTATTDADAINNAMEGLQAMAVGVRPAAVTAAMMRARNASEINIFSDRSPPEAALAGLDSESRVEMHLVGSNVDNIAVVSVDAGVPGVSQGRAVLRNFAPRPRLFEFGVDLDGEPVHRAPLTLAPGEQLVVPFGPLTHGGLLEARIRTADALAADNARFAYATANASSRVLVLSPDRGVRDDLARVLLAVNPNFVIQAADPAEFKADPAGEPFDLEIGHDSSPGSLAGSSVLYIYPRESS